MKSRATLEEVISMKSKLLTNLFLEGVVPRVFTKYNHFVRSVGERHRPPAGENGPNLEHE